MFSVNLYPFGYCSSQFQLHLDIVYINAPVLTSFHTLNLHIIKYIYVIRVSAYLNQCLLNKYIDEKVVTLSQSHRPSSGCGWI